MAEKQREINTQKYLDTIKHSKHNNKNNNNNESETTTMIAKRSYKYDD